MSRDDARLRCGSEDESGRRPARAGGCTGGAAPSAADAALVAVREVLAEAAAANARLTAAYARTPESSHRRGAVAPEYLGPSSTSNSPTTTTTTIPAAAAAAAAENAEHSNINTVSSPYDFSEETQEVWARQKSRRAALLERQRALAERLGRRQTQEAAPEPEGTLSACLEDHRLAALQVDFGGGVGCGGVSEQVEEEEDEVDDADEEAVRKASEAIDVGGVGGAVGYLGGPPSAAGGGGSVAQLEAALAQLRNEVESPCHPARANRGGEGGGGGMDDYAPGEYPPEYDIDAAYGRGGATSDDDAADDISDWAAGDGDGDGEEVVSPFSAVRSTAAAAALPSPPPRNAPDPEPGDLSPRPAADAPDGFKIPSKDETLDLIAVMEERARNKHAEHMGVEAPALSTWALQREGAFGGKGGGGEGGTGREGNAAIAVRGLRRLNQGRGEAGEATTGVAGGVAGMGSVGGGDDSDDSEGLSPRWTGGDGQGGRGEGRGGAKGSADSRSDSDSPGLTPRVVMQQRARSPEENEEEEGQEIAFREDETGKLRGVTDFSSLMEYCFD